MKKLILHSFLLASTSFSALALAQTDCPTYTHLTRSLDLDRVVPVILRTTTGGSAVTTALNDTLTALSADAAANGTGNTFQLAATPPTDGSQYIEIYFDDAAICGSTRLNCHAAKMQVEPTDPNAARYASGEIHIGITKNLCNGATCYNPSLPNYLNALRASIYHEFDHALGFGDTGFSLNPNDDSIMAPLRGVNNSNYQRVRTLCDLKKLKEISDAKRQSPAPAYTYTCVG